jgi:predicted amidohydrolase YtcJ
MMDLVLLGGNILTMDPRNTRAEAIAVDSDRIAAIGANAEIAPCVGPATTVVQLVGRTLLPGFMNPRNHFSLTTFASASVDCCVPPQRDLGLILEAIATAVKAAPRGHWIRSRGFTARLIREKRALTRWELDEAVPDTPCVLWKRAAMPVMPTPQR